MLRYTGLVTLLLLTLSCTILGPVEERPSGRASIGGVEEYLDKIREWQRDPVPLRERFIGLTTEGRSLLPKGRILPPATLSSVRRHAVPTASNGVLSYLLARRAVNNQEYRLELRTDREGRVLSLVSVYPNLEQPGSVTKPVEQPLPEVKIKNDNRVSSSELVGFLRHVIRGETEQAARTGQGIFTAGAAMPPDYGQKMGQYLKSRRQGSLEYVFYRTNFEGRGQECRLVVDEATSRVRSFAVTNF